MRPIFLTALLVTLIFTFLVLFATNARAQTVYGLHLASVHVPARDYQNNVNPGVYFKTEDGLTGGVYYNTLKRPSVYLGLTGESGPFALTLGVVSGYHKRRRGVPCESIGLRGEGCWWEDGNTNARLQLFLSPSVELPAIMGVAPRVSFMPGFGRSNSAFHLSLERAL